DPQAQQNEPRRRPPAPAGSTRPASFPGAIRRPSPATPRTSPATTGARGALPPCRGRTSSTAIQIGTIATSRAVSPDGTRVSAQTTAPLPPSRRSPPTTVAAPQLRFVGRGAPRQRDQAYRIAPATRKRAAAIRCGGMVSIAKRIPRYVEPQIRYTAANAAITRPCFGGSPVAPSSTRGLLGFLLERDRQLGGLLDALEHDRRARRSDRRDLSETLPEKPAERLRVPGADFHEEAVLARDVVHLEDLRDLGEQLRRRDPAGPVVRSDERESDQAELDRVRIDSRGVALHDSLLFELPDPLEDGGRGEADLPRDLGVRGTGVSLQDRQDLGINFVDHSEIE